MQGKVQLNRDRAKLFNSAWETLELLSKTSNRLDTYKDASKDDATNRWFQPRLWLRQNLSRMEELLYPN